MCMYVCVYIYIYIYVYVLGCFAGNKGFEASGTLGGLGAAEPKGRPSSASFGVQGCGV